MDGIRIQYACRECGIKVEVTTDATTGNDDQFDIVYVRVVPCNCKLQKIKDIVNDD